MKPYHHLAPGKQRYPVQARWKMGYEKADIARMLRIHRTTVEKELQPRELPWNAAWTSCKVQVRVS